MNVDQYSTTPDDKFPTFPHCCDAAILSVVMNLCYTNAALFVFHGLKILGQVIDIQMIGIYPESV